MLLESILVFDICGDNSRLTTVQGSTVMPSIDLYWVYPLLNATIIATNAMVYFVGGYCEVTESDTTRLEACSTVYLGQPALTAGDLQFKRQAASCHATDRCLVVVGGTCDKAFVSIIEMFDAMTLVPQQTVDIA